MQLNSPPSNSEVCVTNGSSPCMSAQNYYILYCFKAPTHNQNVSACFSLMPFLPFRIVNPCDNFQSILQQ